MAKKVYPLNEDNVYKMSDLLRGHSFMVSSRGLRGNPLEALIGDYEDGEYFFSADGEFIGRETNSIGPYGSSDFWEWEFPEDGGEPYVVSTALPETEYSVFYDGWYSVIVVNE